MPMPITVVDRTRQLPDGTLVYIDRDEYARVIWLSPASFTDEQASTLRCAVQDDVTDSQIFDLLGISVHV